MRFIRKNGRVIPIKDGGSKPNPKLGEAYRASAQKANVVGGVATGTAWVGLHEASVHAIRSIGAKRAGDAASFALHHARMKPAVGLAAFGVATAFGANLSSAVFEHKAQKVDRKTQGQIFKRNLGQAGITLASIAAPIAAYVGLKKLGKAIRPLSRAVGEELKFRRARKVTPESVTRPIKGLLGVK